MEIINQIVNFFTDNGDWVFSGIGVFVLTLFFVHNGINKKQRSGKNSNNYMADRDINIGRKDDNN